jgi:hypothetical protein
MDMSHEENAFRLGKLATGERFVGLVCENNDVMVDDITLEF